MYAKSVDPDLMLLILISTVCKGLSLPILRIITKCTVPIKFVINYLNLKTGEKNNQRDVTQKLRKREQSFLYATHHLDLIYIARRFH